MSPHTTLQYCLRIQAEGLDMRDIVKSSSRVSNPRKTDSQQLQQDRF